MSYVHRKAWITLPYNIWIEARVNCLMKRTIVMFCSFQINIFLAVLFRPITFLKLSPKCDLIKCFHRSAIRLLLTSAFNFLWKFFLFAKFVTLFQMWFLLILQFKKDRRKIFQITKAQKTKKNKRTKTYTVFFVYKKHTKSLN